MAFTIGYRQPSPLYPYFTGITKQSTAAWINLSSAFPFAMAKRFLLIDPEIADQSSPRTLYPLTGSYGHCVRKILGRLYSVEKEIQDKRLDVARVGWGIAPRLEHMFLLAGYFK